MNIPAVIISEACQTPMREDEPTRPDSQLSKIWSDAANDMATRLFETSQRKQRCLDTLDVKGAQEAYRYAKELRNLVVTLSGLDALPPEMSATMRRQSVDRVVAIYELVGPLFA